MMVNLHGVSGGVGVAAVIASSERPLVFGIPGGYMGVVFDELRRSYHDVETVLVREESLGTVMAESKARLTGVPAVVMAQGAWILGDASIGIMEAHLASTPMVILLDATDGGQYSHNGPYQAGGGGYGAFDLPAAMQAITKRTFVAHEPLQAVQMTQLAFKHSVEGEPGPVAVVFFERSIHGLLDEAASSRINLAPNVMKRVDRAPAESDIQSAASLLSESGRRRVIIAGNGIRLADARAELISFAERWGAAVVTTPAGKGTIDENHRLAGGSIGIHGQNAANALVAEADAVVAVGTKLGATDTFTGNPAFLDARRQVIVKIDIEPLNINWPVAVSHGVVGDAKAVLPALTSAVDGNPEDASEWVSGLRAKHGYYGDKLTQSFDDGVSPRYLAHLIGTTVPDGAVVCCDAGENRIFMLHDCPSLEGAEFLQPNGGGGMGYAVPAALGAGYAGGYEHTVAVTGDGGYAMVLHGLMTAVENQRRLSVVVFQNGTLGWVQHGQDDDPHMAKFHDFDLAAIAQAMGCRAVTVDDSDSLEAALRDGFGYDGVSVICVKTSLQESFKTITSDWGREVQHLAL